MRWCPAPSCSLKKKEPNFRARLFRSRGRYTSRCLPSPVEVLFHCPLPISSRYHLYRLHFCPTSTCSNCRERRKPTASALPAAPPPLKMYTQCQLSVKGSLSGSRGVMEVRSRVLQANKGCHLTHVFTPWPLRQQFAPSPSSSSRNNTKLASLLRIRPRCPFEYVFACLFI